MDDSFPCSLDVPAAGAVLDGEAVLVSGWAYSTASDIAAVEVYLDDTLLGAVPFGRPCPGVVPEHHPRAAMSGFRGEVPVSRGVSGEHRLVVRVRDRGGACRELVRTVAVPAAVIEADLDQPAAGAVLSDSVAVDGWAFSRRAGLRAIEVLVDDLLVGSARHGLPRPDVAAEHRQQAAGTSGFHATLALPSLTAGRHTLRVRITDANRNQRELRRPVEVAQETIAACLDPGTHGSRVTDFIDVAGWAFSLAARIESIEARLDGLLLGSVAAGLERPDVAREYPSRDVLRCGFATVLPLPPVATGRHRLTLHITDANGNRREIGRSLDVESFAIRGVIDEPADQQTVSGAVTVSGWTGSLEGAITRIEAFLGAVPLGEIPWRVEPAGAVAALPIPALPCLFSRRLELPRATAGVQRLRLVVHDGAGHRRELERPIAVVPGTTLLGSIDQPASGDTLSEVLEVSGWAFSTASRRLAVEASLGGKLLGRLDRGEEREDVSTTHPAAFARRPGFRDRWPIPGDLGGDDVDLVVRVTDDQGEELELRRSVRVLERPIHARLDLPEDRSESERVLDVSGWACSLEAPIARVQAYLNERPLGALVHGLARPDVTKVRPWYRSADIGFKGRFPVDPAVQGRARLDVRIEDQRGNRLELTRTLFLLPEHLRLHLDAPRPGSGFAGRIEIGGWAFSELAPIVRVEAQLGEVSLGVLPLGNSRPDVEESLGDATAARCGFHAVREVSPVEPGPARLQVRAFDAIGAMAEAQVDLVAVALADPQMEVERVVWRGSLLHVEGWGLWPPSTAARRARVFVDGRLLGETRANLSRPDLLGRFPGYRDGRRCGFQFRAVHPPADGGGSGELRVELESQQGQRMSRTLGICHETRPNGSARQRIHDDLMQLCSDFGARFGRQPTILDWDTGLDLATDLRGQVVFRPPARKRDDVLPYMDRSLDVVVTRDDGARRAEEARRVAGAAVLLLGEAAVRVEWGKGVATPLTAEGAAPEAAIVIPVHNHRDYTERCLERVLETIPTHPRIEVIVVDDASTDDTEQLLRRIRESDSRVTTLRNAENLGFVATCNRGARAASAHILVFLNNDTVPRPGWLTPLVSFFADHTDAGAVGGKLLYPDGVLQEAGGVIFADATGYNFGKHDPDADAPLYSHVREVDYCSGALLATPRDLFLGIGGFDLRYAPAYYEDADYCFAVRERGLKVYFQPASVVVHHEGVSSGTDLRFGVKRHQVPNRIKFMEKWQTALAHQPPPPDRLERRHRFALAVRGDVRRCEDRP